MRFFLRRYSGVEKYALSLAVLHCIAIFLFSALSFKTPNFAWMHAIWPISSLDDVDVFGIYIPIFRPLVFLEKLEYQVYGDVFITNNFLYGAIFSFLAFITCYRSIWIGFIFLFFYPLIIISSDGGVVYDAVFCLSLVLFIMVCSEFQDGPNVSLQTFLRLSLAIVLGDLSRPFMLPMIAALIVLMPAFLKNVRLNLKFFFITVFVSGAFVGVFHYHQYLETGSVILSNFGGCNVGEVFRVGSNIDFSRSLNLSYVSAECQRQLSVVSNLVLNNPNTLFLDGQVFYKAINVWFPDIAFHGNRGWALENRFWAGPIFSRFSPLLYVLFLIVLISAPENRKFVPTVFSLFLFTYTILNVYSHNGTESVRMLLPVAVAKVYLISKYIDDLALMIRGAYRCSQKF